MAVPSTETRQAFPPYTGSYTLTKLFRNFSIVKRHRRPFSLLRERGERRRCICDRKKRSRGEQETRVTCCMIARRTGSKKEWTNGFTFFLELENFETRFLCLSSILCCYSRLCARTLVRCLYFSNLQLFCAKIKLY